MLGLNETQIKNKSCKSCNEGRETLSEYSKADIVLLLELKLIKCSSIDQIAYISSYAT